MSSVMATTEQNEEQNTNRIQVVAKIQPAIFEAVERLAREDERSLSNMIERLLKQSPQVKEILESESAIAA